MRVRQIEVQIFSRSDLAETPASGLLVFFAVIANPPHANLRAAFIAHKTTALVAISIHCFRSVDSATAKPITGRRKAIRVANATRFAFRFFFSAMNLNHFLERTADLGPHAQLGNFQAEPFGNPAHLRRNAMLGREYFRSRALRRVFVGLPVAVSFIVLNIFRCLMARKRLTLHDRMNNLDDSLFGQVATDIRPERALIARRAHVVFHDAIIDRVSRNANNSA